MTSTEYANTADEIIGKGADRVSMAFDSRKGIVIERVAPLVAKLHKDEDGKILNDKHNRVLIGRILLIMKKTAKEAKKDAIVTYRTHDKLVTRNVKSYYGKTASIA